MASQLELFRIKIDRIDFLAPGGRLAVSNDQRLSNPRERVWGHLQLELDLLRHVLVNPLTPKGGVNLCGGVFRPLHRQTAGPGIPCRPVVDFADVYVRSVREFMKGYAAGARTPEAHRR